MSLIRKMMTTLTKSLLDTLPGAVAEKFKTIDEAEFKEFLAEYLKTETEAPTKAKAKRQSKPRAKSPVKKLNSFFFFCKMTREISEKKIGQVDLRNTWAKLPLEEQKEWKRQCDEYNADLLKDYQSKSEGSATESEPETKSKAMKAAESEESEPEKVIAAADPEDSDSGSDSEPEPKNDHKLDPIIFVGKGRGARQMFESEILKLIPTGGVTNISGTIFRREGNSVVRVTQSRKPNQSNKI